MSEAESPDLLSAEHEVTAEDVRALTGASTPHFALQVRNRVRRLIAPLPAGHPARLEGERQIAALEELSRHSGDPRGAGRTDTLARGATAGPGPDTAGTGTAAAGDTGAADNGPTEGGVG
ncbi:MAG TPA: hypothetical protein VFD37_04765 [Solirubrobacterales bacterium]|nr:hypothetical protein [Solirubrobacterales bacterium]